MTTIVAYADGSTVWMASDSATNVYDRPIIGGVRKLLRLPAGAGYQVLLGVAGAGGLPGCLAANLKIDAVPLPGEDVDAWAHAIACAICEIASDAGLMDEGVIDGSVLLGWGGRLWTISQSCACSHPDGRAAIGSGHGPAIGALDVLLDSGVEAAEAVVQAVQVGIARDRYTGGPVQMERLAGPDEPEHS
ncbi:hypothetical protein ABZY58_11660 [Micromonospora tulbaghiae]|uniref:hypothetical protein n=1 Tax=Micromonospora tulbaghiae TaxID=479978 RepID=UPI0033A9CF9E